MLCLSLIFVPLFTGCAAPAPAAKFVEQAERMHSGALASTVVADTDLNDYLQAVADRLVEAAKVAAPNRVNAAFLSQVRCQLVNCNTLNAFTTGGNHVYVSTGLFQQCQSEEELAASIAHAYAHLIDLDLEATKMKPNPAEPLSMVAWDFVTNRYTKLQEERADQLAIAIFGQAGYEPGRFSNVFEHMESFTGGNVAPDRQPLPERAAALQAAALDMKRAGRALPVADPKTFVSLRDKAGQYHEPPSVTVALIFLRAMPNCVLSADTAEQKDAQERLRPVLPPARATVEPN